MNGVKKNDLDNGTRLYTWTASSITSMFLSRRRRQGLLERFCRDAEARYGKYGFSEACSALPIDNAS